MTRVEKVHNYIMHVANTMCNIQYKKTKEVYDDIIGPIIEKFIKNNNYIIKNNMILRKLDPKLVLPDSDYYYEIYTDKNGYNKLKSLSDKMYAIHSPAFTYLEAMSVGQFIYDLKSNFVPIIRIVTLQDHIYKKLPYQLDNTTGLRFLDPNIMRLQVYNIYCNPTQCVDSWKDAYLTEQALNKLFPIKNNTTNTTTTNTNVDIQKLTQWIDNNNNIILAGDAALNILLQIAGDKQNVVPIQQFVVLSQNPNQEITNIKKLFTGKIKVKKNKSCLQYYKEQLIVYHNDRIIVTIYNVSDKCYPFTQINNTLKIATVHLLIKFYLIQYVENKNQRQSILHKIYTLQTTRNKYMKRKGITGIEKGPMQVFHHICWGTELNVQRQLKIWCTEKKYYSHRYKPT